jgi:hypothetical protein
VLGLLKFSTLKVLIDTVVDIILIVILWDV